MSKRLLEEDDEDCLPRIDVISPTPKGPPKDTIATSLVASLIASLAVFNFGYALDFTSPTQKKMVDEDKVLDTEEFSWFGSIVALGAIVGSMLGGSLVQRIGRKFTIMSTSVFYAIGWSLISYSKNTGMLYAGRLVSGCGVGIAALSVPMYISEIASARYRGGLCSINQLSISSAAVFVYIVGEEIGWRWFAMIPVMISALSVILMAFMPETPVWLLANKKRSRALMNLIWLRGEHHDSEIELREIEANLANQEKMSFSGFLKPQLYRPLIIGCMLMVFQQFVGINAILFYCDDVFTEAGIKWNASILVGVVLFAFTIVACLIVDRFGRRILLLIGSVAMFICMFLLGLYYDIVVVDPTDMNHGKPICIFGHSICHTVATNKIYWLAITSVLIYTATFAVGWGPLPWVMMGELFPPRARGQASSIVTIVNLLFTFVIAKTFTSFKTTFHEQGTFWFYSAFCLLSFIYTLFRVPETKGKSLEEIERSFSTQY